MGDGGEEKASSEGGPIRKQGEQGESREERGKGGQQRPCLCQPQRQGAKSESAG